ncbi:MAG: FAD-binding oxidoreductase [Rhodospirillaceae bacterium]|nr:FAD-binding oxidoreductase [Rhodospirillaceae bacterium]
MTELPDPTAMTQQAAALAKIRDLVGARGWIDSADGMAPHLKEERGNYVGVAAAVVKPGSVEEMAGVLRLCHGAGLPVVPQGGNTSLVGASIPFEDFTGIVLSTSRLNRIRELDPVNNTVTADAGCILQTIQQAASDADRLFPLSLGAEGSCQIGGNISTNAGGVGVLRYGTMRELVLGLEVALPDGRIWDGLRGLRKDNTGYDLKQWFVGAEGTLGVITGAVLKLFPKPRETVTAVAAIPGPDAALRLLGALQRETGGGVSGYEIMTRQALQMALDHIAGVRDPFRQVHPCYQLIELTGPRADGSLRAGLEDVLAAAMADGDVRDAVISESGGQDRALWRLREAISEAQKFEGASIKHDVAVPVSRVADFMRVATAACEAALPGIRVVAFGHVGDGNIHFNMNQPAEGWSHAGFMAEQPRFNRIVHDIVADMKGSISAEHGIGRIKKAELAHYHAPLELELMRALKAQLDPKGIMNPGKVF